MRQRKLLLPSFHGEAIERYTAMIAAGSRTRDRPLAAARAVRARAGDAGDHPRRDHVRASSASRARREQGTPEHACAKRSAGRRQPLHHAPSRRRSNCSTSIAAEPIGPSSGCSAALDRALYAVIAARRAAGDADGAHRHPLAAAGRARRGRRADERPGASRRAAHARARRARDHRQLAGVGVRAAAPHTPRLRAPARGGSQPDERSGRGRGVRRGDDPRGDALPPGHPRDRPARDSARGSWGSGGCPPAPRC